MLKLSKNATPLLLFLAALLFVGCDLGDSEDDETLDEEDLKTVITFNEWLYRAGSPPRLKYYIEKETKQTVRLESALTMYHDEELVGINAFSVTLNSPINIDYFVIEPDKNLPVTQIELKDVYIDGVKYSVSKTFNVVLEAGTTPDVPKDRPTCSSDPGTEYVEENRDQYGPRRRVDGRSEDIMEWSLLMDHDNNQLTVCLVTLPAGDLYPSKRTYKASFVKGIFRDGKIPYDVIFVPNYRVRMNEQGKLQQHFIFDESSGQGKKNDDLIHSGRGFGFVPPREILAPEAVVQVSTLSATSFTVLVTNPNTFAENKLFWILNSGSGPDSSFELLEIINNDSPIAKSSDLGMVIPASDGTTHGTKEVSINTGISSETSYSFHAFVKTGGYSSPVSSSSTITTL